MSDMQTVRDDLAFLRTMAEGGRQPGRHTGVILATGGFAYGLASCAAWAVLDGRLPGGTAAIWAPWLLATVVFYAVLFAALRGVTRGERARPGPNQLSGLAWAAMGGVMFSVILATVVANVVTGSPLVWTSIPSIFIALYGAGWTVAAAAAGRGWMRGVALASFAGAVALAFLAGRAEQYLAYGAALMLLGGIPGLALMRAPSSTAAARA